MTNPKHKHISYEERIIIEKMLDNGHSIDDIAKFLKKSKPTIYNELKRCKSNYKYNADCAQEDCDKNKKNKGKKAILEFDEKLAKYISSLIINEGLSPVEIIKKLQKEGYHDIPCRNTIYSAIYAGLIPSVNRDTLLEKRKSKKTHMFSGSLIHIPSWVCDELELTEGEDLDIDVIGKEIVIRKSKQK